MTIPLGITLSLNGTQPVENGLARVSKGVEGVGVSAAQTVAAMRMIPAQFTDIVTGLASGQAPLTVLLQQGGQLKDMFGGAGEAAKALGTYVVGLINPFTLVAAAAATVAVAYNQGSKEADAYRLAIVSTGNAVGTTTGQLQGYAQEISNVIGTQGKAAESLAAFVSTGKVSRDVLKEAAQSAVAWERATGQAVGTTAKQFADLAKDPLQAVLQLNQSTNFLTESVYKQIKSLEDQGRTADAAAVAQRAYADALTSRSSTVTQNLGYIEKAWQGITGAAKKGWDAMLNVGRSSTPADATAELRARLNKQQEELAAKRAINPYADTSGLEKGIEVLKQRIGLLESDERQTRRNAEAEAARAAQNAAAVEWDKEGAKYLSDKAKLERELTKARNEGLAAGKSQAEIETRLAQIRESYAKKGGSTAASENKELRERQRIYAELAGVSSTYYSDLAAAQEQRAKGNIGEAEYIKYVEELIQKQPFAVAQEKERAQAIKDSAKAAAESSKALSAWYDARERESQGLASQIASRREEVSMMGMTTEAVIEYTRAKFEQQAAEKEAYAAALESASFYAGEYAQAYRTAADAARQQAAQLRELGGLEVSKANAEANKRYLDDWKQSVTQYDDIFRRGFADMLNSGKDGWKSFTRSLVTTFKTTVADQIYKMFAQPFVVRVVGSMMGMIGSNAAAGVAGQVGSSFLSSAGGSMLGNMVGGFGAFTGAMGSGFSMALNGGMGLALEGGAAMLGSATGMSSALAGIGQIAGALGPIALGIGALYSILSGLDDSGTYHTGGAAQYSAARGLVSGQDATDYNIGYGRVERGQETIDTVSRLAQGLVQSLDGVATSFGRTAGFEIATAFADDTSGDGATGAFRISRDGKELLNWENDRQSKWGPREFADGQEGYQQYLNTIAKDTRQVLMDMDLASWADKLLTGLGETPTMEALTNVITQINQIQSAFEGLGNSMEMFAGLTDEMQSGLLDAAGSIDALTAGAGAFYQGFYSEQERMDSLSRQVQEALGKLDLSIDPSLGDDAKDQFRAAVEAAFAAGDAELAASLLAISGNFASAADYFEQLSETAAQAAEAAARSAKDAALRDLQNAISRDRNALQDQASTLQETISGISSAVEMLRSNAADLYGTVEDTAQALAARGMVYVEQALAGVKAGASVTDYTGLSDAISAARGGISKGAYSSEFERQRDTLVLAGQLSQLGDLSDLQLSVEERQLKAINDQIDYLDSLNDRAQAMVDGTTALTESVQTYFDRLLKLLEPADPSNGATVKPLAVGSTFSSGPSGGSTPSNSYSAVNDIRAYLDQTLDPNLIRTTMWIRGWSVEDIATAAGQSVDFVQQYLDLPKFAVGTNYVPKDMAAIVHEGEAIVPKAYNPWANGGGSMGGDNSELIAEVRALREEVAALRASGQAIAENTSGTPQMVRQFDQVTQGGNAIRNKAIA